MLFPLNLDTPQCEVLKALNNELLHFLGEAVESDHFDYNLFSTGENNVCWDNKITRGKFKDLWEVMPVQLEDRQALSEMIAISQDLATYFDDTTLPLPEITDERLYKAFKALTSYLYTNTKDLAGAKVLANSSIEQHYQDFIRANGNTQLCYLCGTACLSQNRVNLDDKDQWRADYDHVLCQSNYPVYSIHPENFIPTCHICNSKAKGARNLLKKEDGTRRTAFYPLPPSQESCYEYATVSPKFRELVDMLAGRWEEPLASSSVEFLAAPPDISEKIDVWDEVYQVPSRVEKQIITHFCERVAADLHNPQTFEEFHAGLGRISAREPVDIKITEWRSWWYKVYQWLNQQADDAKRDAWMLIEWKLNVSVQNNDMEETFAN